MSQETWYLDEETVEWEQKEVGADNHPAWEFNGFGEGFKTRINRYKPNKKGQGGFDYTMRVDAIKGPIYVNFNNVQTEKMALRLASAWLSAYRVGRFR